MTQNSTVLRNEKIKMAGSEASQRKCRRREVRIEQRQREDAIRDSLTDDDVEAELCAVTQVVSERRKREIALEDARKWARNAVAEMKFKRSEGTATERDEAEYEEKAEGYLRMVRRAKEKLAACSTG